MATDTEILVDGSRNLVVKTQTTGASDVTDEQLVDISTLDPAASRLKLMTIEASLIGCSAVLEWAHTTDDVLLSLPEGENIMDFKDIGGISDPASAGGTGDPVITTSGLGAGDSITLIMRFKKKELV